jgi:uncharacterized protein YndB with AHSA1/START domain
MAEIVATIEISRPPEDVFAYAADPTHHPEWIETVVSARHEKVGPLTVGSKVLAIRRVGPWTVKYAEEMTEFQPPRTWANHGVGRIPVIAYARGLIEPLDGGTRSRLTIGCEFRGHGIGKLLAPILARRLTKLLPKDQQKLKEVLERVWGADSESWP